MVLSVGIKESNQATELSAQGSAQSFAMSCVPVSACISARARAAVHTNSAARRTRQKREATDKRKKHHRAAELLHAVASVAA